MSLLALLAVGIAVAAPLHITFFNPGHADGPFWSAATELAQQAADAQDIELEVVYAERNHLAMVRQVKEVVSRPVPPDVVIVVNERLMAPHMLQAANDASVPVFLAHNLLTKEQHAEHGGPGDQLPYWIGAFGTDDNAAGRLIADALVRRAHRVPTCPRAPDGSLQIIALHGDRVTPASTGRRDGLQAYVNRTRGVTLAQEVWVDWRRDTAQEATEVLLARYPDACLIWAANDAIALGALDAAKAAGRSPDGDVLIAGLNGSDEAIKAIRNREITATVAGHLVTIAVSLSELRRRADEGTLTTPHPSTRWPLYAIVDAGRAAQYDTWRNLGWGGIDLEALRNGTPWGGANDLRIAIPMSAPGTLPFGAPGAIPPH
jgi:ABC-type sugar transport system substrate-binding protein